MATSLDDRVGEDAGYDSETGMRVGVIKAVNVTDECPARRGGDQKVNLFYIERTQGRGVRLEQCHPGQDCGRSIGYELDSEDFRWVVRTYGYPSAFDLGLSREEFVALVLQHAPERTGRAVPATKPRPQ